MYRTPAILLLTTLIGLAENARAAGQPSRSSSAPTTAAKPNPTPPSGPAVSPAPAPTPVGKPTPAPAPLPVTTPKPAPVTPPAPAVIPTPGKSAGADRIERLLTAVPNATDVKTGQPINTNVPAQPAKPPTVERVEKVLTPPVSPPVKSSAVDRIEKVLTSQPNSIPGKAPPLRPVHIQAVPTGSGMPPPGKIGVTRIEEVLATQPNALDTKTGKPIRADGLPPSLFNRPVLPEMTPARRLGIAVDRQLSRAAWHIREFYDDGFRSYGLRPPSPKELWDIVSALSVGRKIMLGDLPGAGKDAVGSKMEDAVLQVIDQVGAKMREWKDNYLYGPTPISPPAK